MNALHYALSHKAETVALTKKIIHAKPDDPRPAFVYDDAVKHHAVDPTLPLPADKLNWIQEQLVKAGKLKKPLDLKTVTAPECREKALKMMRALSLRRSQARSRRRPKIAGVRRRRGHDGVPDDARNLHG